MEPILAARAERVIKLLANISIGFFTGTLIFNKKINVKPAGWERKTIDFYKTKCYGEGE